MTLDYKVNKLFVRMQTANSLNQLNGLMEYGNRRLEIPASICIELRNECAKKFGKQSYKSHFSLSN